METIIDNKHFVEEVTQTVSNPDKPSFSKGSPNPKDEIWLRVDQEGELMNGLDDLKKSRKGNKALKEQLKEVE